MFKVSFTRGGALLEKAQELRQKVFFNCEGQDSDEFDRYCRHLLIIDKNTDSVVGTYRLLAGSVADKGLGFYSESEFNLRNIKKNCKGKLLEIGRACVDNSYRKRPVIKLMWKQLIMFFKKNKVSYVFGCASIDSPSPEKMGKIYGFFKRHCLAGKDYRVYPLRGKRYPYIKNKGNIKEIEVLRLLPSLVRGYLKMGAVVCGEPVWDKDFNTADFFMLLDTAKMNANYQKKFL